MDITINLSGITLETQRLLLRTWKENDLEDFYEYASVNGVGEMAGWNHHESIEISKSILEGFISSKNVFAVVYKENNKVIGSLGIHKSWTNEDDSFCDIKVKELGYVLSKGYWGRGLMPEAVEEIIRFCFDELGLDALTIGHFHDNSQSRRVLFM